MSASRILIVEDEPIVALDLSKQLSAIGYEVAGTATSGEEAIALARSASPDLLIMDIHLEGEMDGITATEEILRQQDIPVIFLTAYSEETLVDRAKQIGPHGYITKPFTERNLKINIEMALYKSDTEKKLRASEQRYATTLRSVGDAIITTNPTGYLTYLNPVAERLMGWKLAEALGQPLAGMLRLISEDTRQPMRNPVDEVLLKGMTTRLPHHTLLVSRDGTEIPVDDSTSPIFDDNLNLIGVVVVFSDISARRKLEKEMEASEVRFRELFENINSGVAIYKALDEGSDFVITALNKAAERITRVSRKETLGRPVSEVFPSVREFGLFTIFQEVWRDGTPRRHPTTLYKDSNLELWMENYVYRLPSGEIVAIFDNVTERKRAVDELRENKERLDIALSSSQMGTFLWDIPTGKNTWDAQNLRLYGLPPGSPSPTGEEFLRLIVPEDRPATIAARDSALEGRSAYEAEHRITWPDGSIHAIAVRGSIQRDAGGKPARLVGVCWDVTQRRLADEKIREQAMLMEQSHDGIGLLDLQGRVQFGNPALERSLGRPMAELQGRHICDFVSGDCSITVLSALEQANGRGTWQGEFIAIHPASRNVHLDATINIIRLADGTPRGLLLIAADVTGRKALEQQVLRTQRLESIGLLAGGIAHDLNNILGPILMAAPFIQERIADESMRRMLDIIEANARRGADIVKRVLTFARGIEGLFGPLQVRHVITDTARLMRETFPKEIILKVNCDHDLWVINGDATQMNQVLMNLCVNARDAMPNGGTLTIDAVNTTIGDADSRPAAGAPRPGRYIKLSVSDTGTGIPGGIINQIFDPFFTTKEVGKGTGLGLSTVQGIVLHHDGFITVTSTPGAGTRFDILLPASGATVDEGPVKGISDIVHGGGELILLIDDEISMRSITEASLEVCGYSVLTAANGSEGINLFKQHQKDVAAILCDMVMPVMSGPDVIRAVHKLSPSTPVIGMSGHVPDEKDAHFTQLPLRGMLLKPFTNKQLCAAIQNALREARPAPEA